MKLRKNKKGFTIVELVIVIAVIGVLTAVLVPTFIHLTSKANEASDQSLVKNLNTVITTLEAEPGYQAGKTPTQNFEKLDGLGYNVEKLVKGLKSDKKVLYYLDKNRFLFEADKDTSLTDDKYWEFVNANNTNGYSKYLNTEFSGKATVAAGCDVGLNDDVTEVDYTATGNTKVVIRTNGGTLKVNNPNGTVSHYENADKVNVEAIAGASYHENGNVSYLELKKGRVVAEANGVVETVLVTGTEVEIKKEEGGNVNLTYAASEEIKEAIAQTSQGIVATVVEEGTEVSNFVARTSAAGFETLEEAIENAALNDTVVLLKDVEIEDVVITKGLTLDGKNRAITGAPGYRWTDGTNYEETGHGGLRIDLAANGATTVNLKDFDLSNVGNYAAIAVSYNTNNVNLTLNATNLKISNYYNTGIAIRQGTFVVDACYINAESNANTAYNNGIAGGSKSHNNVVGVIKNTTIVNSDRESDKWAGSAVNFYAPCDITVEKCYIERSTNGVAVGVNSVEYTNPIVAKLTVNNTQIIRSGVGISARPSGAKANDNYPCSYDITLGKDNVIKADNPVYGIYKSSLVSGFEIVIDETTTLVPDESQWAVIIWDAQVYNDEDTWELDDNSRPE